MANTIKLKQGSGSDPSASDLVLGEPAIRTDTGEIFLKKDDGSIAKVAGGIDDGDKGDITVSNDGGTFTIDNGVVSTGKIADNAVTMAKLQDLDQNRIFGRIASGSGNPTALTAANVRTMINVADGATNVTNTNQLTNGAGFITATLTNEQVQDIVGGMVTGNTESGITVTYQDGDGTLDFSVASQTDQNFTTTLKNKLDGIASGATNVTNTNQLTNGAGFITATLTNEQVQDIVGGMVTGNTESGITVTYQDGDGTLDFSVASQTDNNFTNADHSKLDGIEAGATADQTASEILTLIKTVDGAGSGLDADTLDGISSASFLRSDANDTTTGNITFGSSTNEKIVLAGSSNPYIRWQEGTTDKAYIQWNANGYLDLVNQETNDGLRIQSGSNGLKYRIDGTSYNVWHQANDGSGSGLDADSVDGIAGSSLLRSDTADTASGDITFSGGAGAVTVSAASDIRIAGGTWTGEYTGGIKIQPDANNAYIQYHGVLFFRDEGSTNNFQLNQSGDATFTGSVLTTRVSLSNGILETKAAIATSHTLTADYNALAVSPTINSGVTVTVPSGAVWAIV